MSIVQGEKESTSIEKRRIHISSKRQVTIPVKYFQALGFSDEVDCICANGMLILTPVKDEDSTFAEEILSDLIQQGYSGPELLAEFRRVNKKVRPAIQRIIEEADELARAASDEYVDPTDDVFGEHDESEA